LTHDRTIGCFSSAFAGAFFGFGPGIFHPRPLN
jgi:hypothetical protein